MSRQLPSYPNLDHLKKEAKDVLRLVRRQRPGWKLADAQHAIARGYGYSSWPDLKAEVESARRTAFRDGALSSKRQGRGLDAPPRPDSRTEHPICGTWILNPATSTQPQTFQHQVLLFEVAVSGETVTITQVTVDASGNEVAAKMTIQADGQEHQTEYGPEHVLQARWTSPHVLETVFKNGDQMLGRGTYEASEDGKTLTVSTNDQVIVFDRCPPRPELRFRAAPISSLALCVAGLAASIGCHSACEKGSSMPTRPVLDEDLRAIEALNQHDVKAALAGDITAIVSQWTDDFVVLPPTGPIVRGRATNAAMAEQVREQMKALEPVDYVVEFQEIKVLGDYAYEWGTYRGSARPRGGGDSMSYGGKLMRILQRQPDGTWKMHRTMVTNEPTSR